MWMKTLIPVLFVSNLYAQELPATPQVNDSATTGETVIKPVNRQTDRQTDRQADKMYRMKYGIDIPIIAVGGAATIYSFTIIYTKKNTPEATILALNKNNIPAFDRWATQYHDPNMDKISYYPFYACMPLPALLFIDKNMRKDAGQITTLYLEAFAFTGVLYAGSVYYADRFRPDVYNTSLPLSYRENGNYRNSFFAGHVAVMATSTFFMAKVFDDYHPESNWKWVMYGGATAATLGMSYMRLEAGKHFPSDILTGAIIGTTSGILTPMLHKNKNMKRQKWSLSPTFIDPGGAGFAFTYGL